MLINTIGFLTQGDTDEKRYEYWLKVADANNIYRNNRWSRTFGEQMTPVQYRSIGSPSTKNYWKYYFLGDYEANKFDQLYLYKCIKIVLKVLYPNGDISTSFGSVDGISHWLFNIKMKGYMAIVDYNFVYKMLEQWGILVINSSDCNDHGFYRMDAVMPEEHIVFERVAIGIYMQGGFFIDDLD